jgi:hypothetical protein
MIVRSDFPPDAAPESGQILICGAVAEWSMGTDLENQHTRKGVVRSTRTCAARKPSATFTEGLVGIFVQSPTEENSAKVLVIRFRVSADRRFSFAA